MKTSTVKKLKIIEFIDGMYFATIVTNLFALSQGVSLANVVIAQSVFSGVVLLSEVPTGFVADKFSRKASLALGYFTSALGLMALVISPTTFGLYLMNVVRAIGLSLVSGANEALLFEASEREGLNYKKQSSIVMSNGVAGLFTAGLITAFVYGEYNSASYVPLIVATAVLQVGISAFSLTLLDSRNEDQGDSVVEKEQKLWSSLKDTFKLMRSNSTIFALTMIGLLTICNEYFLYGTYGPHFENMGVANFWVGAAFSAGLFMNFVLQRYVYVLEKYFTFEKAFSIIKVGSIIGYIGLAFATQSDLIVVLVISTIGLFNLERPLISDYANQELESRTRATVLSGMSLASRLTKMIMTVLLGFVVAGGSLQPGYFVQGVFMLVGLGISYWLLVRCGCVRRFKHPATSSA